MFKQIEPFSNEIHENLRFTSTNFSFASETHMVQLSFSEMRAASRFYPIVFPANQPNTPHAILSFKENSNNFVDDNGNWTVPYVPFIIRAYPFILAKNEDEKDQLILCIDPQAPHFREEFGEIMFKADGSINDFTKKIMDSLNLYYAEMEHTKKLFAKLTDNDLMEDKQISVTKDYKEQTVGGFKAVEMEKLLEMDDKFIAELVKEGTMHLVYEHLNSIPNLNTLANNI